MPGNQDWHAIGVVQTYVTELAFITRELTGFPSPLLIVVSPPPTACYRCYIAVHRSDPDALTDLLTNAVHDGTVSRTSPGGIQAVQQTHCPRWPEPFRPAGIGQLRHDVPLCGRTTKGSGRLDYVDATGRLSPSMSGSKSTSPLRAAPLQALHDDPATLTRLKGQPAVADRCAAVRGPLRHAVARTVRTIAQGPQVYITDWKTLAWSLGKANSTWMTTSHSWKSHPHLQGSTAICHVISVCQPTVPVLAAVSLMASRGGHAAHPDP